MHKGMLSTPSYADLYIIQPMLFTGAIIHMTTAPLTLVMSCDPTRAPDPLPPWLRVPRLLLSSLVDTAHGIHRTQVTCVML